MGKTSVSKWLSRTVKENKAKRDRKIKEMYMACYTQQEIADEVECSQDTVRNLTIEYRSTQSLKPAHLHQVDFTIPIYNVWKQQDKSNAVNHFGNTEVTFLDNLLYLYTKAA